MTGVRKVINQVEQFWAGNAITTILLCLLFALAPIANSATVCSLEQQQQFRSYLFAFRATSWQEEKLPGSVLTCRKLGGLASNLLAVKNNRWTTAVTDRTSWDF